MAAAQPALRGAWQPSDRELFDQDAGSPADAGGERARVGKWLSRALQAERAAVARLLEARHSVLVQQFERRGQQGLGRAQVTSADELTRSAPVGALRTLAPPSPRTLPGSLADSAEAPEAPGGQPSGVLPDLAWDAVKLQDRDDSLVTTRELDTVPTTATARASADSAAPLHQASTSDVHWRSSQLSVQCRRTSAQVINRVTSTVFRKREEQTTRLGRLVTSTRFEAAGALLVIVLAVCMAMESQYSGLDLGFQLGYGSYFRPAARVWPWAVDVLDVMSFVLGVAFCFELALKLLGLGLHGTFKEVWSIFDAVITVLWIAEVVHLDRQVHSDAHLIRVIRIFRLVRFIRLVKTIRMLDSLYLICTALRGSVSALGWASVILFLAQVLVAFLITETLSLCYFNDDRNDEQQRREVFEYFGTFTRAVLSTFEMTLANWPIPCRLLAENVSEWFVVLCLVHKLTVGFAVVGIINGVFIQETFKCAHDDDLILIRQKERALATHVKKMRKLFQAADQNNNGVLDREEFKRILQDRDVRTWLTAMDYDLDDTDMFFSMLDANGSNTISPEEFVNAITRLRGVARSVDVKRLLTEFSIDARGGMR